MDQGVDSAPLVTRIRGPHEHGQTTALPGPEAARARVEHAHAVGGQGADTREAPTRLDRVAPWLAHAMGLAWEDSEAGSAGLGSGRDAVVYDEEEEAMVAERLRALGYLE